MLCIVIGIIAILWWCYYFIEPYKTTTVGIVSGVILGIATGFFVHEIAVIEYCLFPNYESTEKEVYDIRKINGTDYYQYDEGKGAVCVYIVYDAWNSSTVLFREDLVKFKEGEQAQVVIRKKKPKMGQAGKMLFFTGYLEKLMPDTTTSVTVITPAEPKQEESEKETEKNVQ